MCYICLYDKYSPVKNFLTAFDMPLEIRELVIRVTVNERNTGNTEMAIEEKLEEMKKKIVRECIEKLSVKLEALNER